MLKFRQYIRELTISPDYQSRGEFNPFYDLDINLNDITDVVGDGKIKFRSVENEHQFPDTWFANDMYAQGIPIYVSTKSQCKHFNKSWGTYNINFN